MRTLTTAALIAVLTVAPALTPAAQAATGLRCSASMSNAKPTQNSTVYVNVQTAAKAKVQTAAHYKTTTTVHSGTANAKGAASIAYKISRATKGYRVIVKVTVSSGKSTGNCATSFTPH